MWYYSQENEMNFFLSSRNQCKSKIDGHQTVYFEGLYGMQPNTVIAINIGKSLDELTDFNENNSTPKGKPPVLLV
jgi:hypothetical protein